MAHLKCPPKESGISIALVGKHHRELICAASPRPVCIWQRKEIRRAQARFCEAKVLTLHPGSVDE